MSADNCIAVGSFPTKDGGKEYRVIHAQGIENCDDDPFCPDHITDATRFLYYGEAESFLDEASANKKAQELYNNDGGFIEYGIMLIEYNRQLPDMSKEDAVKIVDNYFSRLSERGV